MALEAHQYGGLDITKYIPWIRQTLLFFQDYYTQGDSIVLYPGSACETYKLTRNASNTIAGLRRVAMSLKDYCLSTKASLSTIDSISSSPHPTTDHQRLHDDCTGRAMERDQKHRVATALPRLSLATVRYDDSP